MASIINSVRNITSDNFWAVKIIVYAYFVFFLIINNDIVFQNNPNNIIVLSIISVIYLGSITIMMNRNLNNLSPILPSFASIPEILYKGLMSVVILIPAVIVLFILVNFVNTNIKFDPFIMFVIYTVITLLFVPLMVIPLVLYSANGKIQDAYRFDLVYYASGNFIVQFLSYLIQYAFSIFLITFCLYKLITEMLGYSQPLEIMLSIAGALTIFSFFSFCSDLYGDVIPEIKVKKKKKL